MPFVYKTETEKGTIGIWKMTEPVEELIPIFQFTENEIAEFKKLKSAKRQREYLSTRLLVSKLLGLKSEIVYHETGRPQLKDVFKNISISHSAEFAVVFISDVIAGIDIENTGRNIDRVTTRFLHPKELAWINNLDNNRQKAKIICWCAKEAIYKCSCQTGIRFDTQIFIPCFKLQMAGNFSGILTNGTKEQFYTLSYFLFENNIVVCCVEI